MNDSPLWRQMIEASDKALTRVGDLKDADAAIAAAHLKIIRAWLIQAFSGIFQPDPVLAALTAEIASADGAAGNATKSKGGPADPPNHAPSDATVAASGGEAEAPLTSPRVFQS